MPGTERVEITGPYGDRYDEILTPQAIDLIAALHAELGPRRSELLAARRRRQAELSGGAMLDFLPETAHLREDPDWRVAPPAPGLTDRRVEITGPTDKKMTVNALNSGANVWLADFEDANTPFWDNMITGQLNLKDALDRTIDYTSAEGKDYALRPDRELATIVVRPRGWHLDEKHILIDGVRASGSLVDFALYMTTSAARQIEAGKGPYFYLAKNESHLEARLWNDAFNLAQDFLGIPRGTIRATVLIETIPAAFEMEEILYELREHSAGLNAGRWDYLFSVIKKFRTRGRDFVLPERNSVTMTAPFMRAYTELLVKTCHRRGAHAIGGMAAFIPSRRDAEVNEQAMAKVRDDKTRESGDGFDGSWVAHPDLVPLCKEVFDGVLGSQPNQIDKHRDDVHVTAEDLLAVSKTPGTITEAGLRNNISVALQYLASWLGGSGAVGIFNLMEDAATAEISRSQIWQWIHNDVPLDDGRLVTRDLTERLIDEELSKIRAATGAGFAAGRYGEVAAVVTECARAGIPFVARGSGTGLSGGALPHQDGVLIVLSRMRAIVEIDPVSRRAVVEPGVTNLAVSKAAAPFGLFYAPDPSSQVVCSVGGNVAENSGGAHCLKNGFTVHHVTGLEIVTPSGELTWLGDGTGVTTGYDLLGAFTGSEGTLGIVTKIVVKLMPVPEVVHLLLVAYDTTSQGGQAVSDIIAAGIVPAAVEMMDALAIEAAEAAVHCNYPAGAGAVLLVELDGPAAGVEAELAAARARCAKAGATEIRAADDPAERAGIWAGRKSAFAAVGRISPAYIVQDGVVPRTSLGAVLARIAALSAEAGIRVANVFHAGDGNLHPLVLYDDKVPGQAEAAEKVSGAILDACLEHGGSITGEHGVGVDKSRSMPKMV